MNAYVNIVQKLHAGQPVYLVNEFYSTVIKCIPGTTHWKAKHKGGLEYDIESSADLVYDSFEPLVEISREEYISY